MMSESATRKVELAYVVDPVLTLGPHVSGRHDPTASLSSQRFEKAMRTSAGVATLRLTWASPLSSVFEAHAWGDGAEMALDQASRLLGSDDDPGGFNPTHPLLIDLHRRHRGLRVGASGQVFEVLLNAVLGQRVTGVEAARQWRDLVHKFGEPAPGPTDRRLSPAPDRLAAMPYWEFHRFGIERSRADTIRRIAHHNARLNEVLAMTSTDAENRLRAVRGVGPWTAAHVLALALGDTNAVPVGDYGLPSLVCHAMAGVDGDDDDMLVLLEPMRPHRWRAIRLLTRSGLGPPRRAPRARLRNIAPH